MTTSASRNSSSKQQSAPSISMKPSVLQHLSHVSPNTGIRSQRSIGSAALSKKSGKSRRTIERVRYLIIQEDTGMFLGTLTDGRPVWVKDPLQAMQHCREQTVLRNLYALREFYEIPEILATREMTFYAYASNPLQWFTHDV